MAIQKRSGKQGLSYKVLVKDGEGKWFEALSFARLRDAQDYERECLNMKAKRKTAANKTAKELTFEDYFERWESLCRSHVSPGWRHSQKQMFRDYIQPIVGKKPFLEVGKVQVLKVLNQAAEGTDKKKPVGEQMRLHLWTLLHTMFEDARETFEYIDSNPVLTKYRPDPVKPNHKFLSPDEAHTFLGHIKDHELAPAFWIMTYCGLRIGELQGLQWKHIDLDGPCIRVSQQYRLKEKAIVPRLKNGKPVVVPIPNALLDFLTYRKPLKATDETFVQEAFRGGMVSRDTVYGALKRITKELFGAHKALSPHGLRHSTSELWIEQGATKEDLRRLYNHSSDRSTENYIHETTPRLKDLASMLKQKRPKHLTRVK